MPDSAWTFVLIPLAIVAVLGIPAFFIGYRGVLKRQPRGPVFEASPSLPARRDGQMRRENSRIISQANDENTVLVQFLDVASGACRTAQSFVDDLKQDFGQNVTFVARYFPRPDHAASEIAAIAVEAAAQQNQFNEMLTLMYETQSQWAGAGVPRVDLFRHFAETLGLDMTSFDAAIADSRTKERIEADRADGTALGVSSTPTFFLLDGDGEKVEVDSLDQFRRLVSRAATKE